MISKPPADVGSIESYRVRYRYSKEYRSVVNQVASLLPTLTAEVMKPKRRKKRSRWERFK